MDDYAKLRTLELLSEDFMEEYPENADGELYKYTGIIESGDLNDEKSKYDIYPFN